MSDDGELSKIEDGEKSYISSTSDIADIKSVMLTAATGTFEVPHLDVGSTMQDGTIVFHKKQGPLQRMKRGSYGKSRSVELDQQQQTSAMVKAEPHKSSASNLIMTRPMRMSQTSLRLYSGITQCQVCGDTSSGVHYGVQTCEGCKGFFRRALTDQSGGIVHKMHCVGGGGGGGRGGGTACEVLPGTRNRCQYCRLLKCLRLGMSRNAVKMGRRRGTSMRADHMAVAAADQEDGGGNVVLFVPPRLPDEKGNTGQPLVGEEMSETDLYRELEQARARHRVLMNRKDRLIAPMVQNEVKWESPERLTTPSSHQLKQEEPDSTIKQPSIVSSAPDHHDDNEENEDDDDDCGGYQDGVSRLIDAAALTDHTSSLSGQTQQPLVFFLDDKMFSMMGKQSQLSSQQQQTKSDPDGDHSWLLPSNSSTSRSLFGSSMTTVNRNPPKKRPFPVVETGNDSSVCSETDSPKKTCGVTPKYFTINSGLQDSQQQQYGGASSTVQLQMALGVSAAGHSSSQQLASTVEGAFLDNFQGHLDLQQRYSRDQLASLNDSTLNLLFSDQLWREQATVHINHKIQGLAWDSFHTRFNEIVQDVVRFAKRIPGFAELDTDDRVNLVRNGCFEAGCIIHTNYLVSSADYWVGARVFVLLKTQMKSVLPLDNAFIELIFEFSQRFQKFQLSPAETGLLCAAILINPERVGLINRDRVAKLQEELLVALQLQLQHPRPGPASSGNMGVVMARLLMCCAGSLRELSIEHRRQLATNIRSRFTVPNDLYAETFDLI